MSEEKNSIPISFSKFFLLILNGYMLLIIPKIKARLAIFEPIKFPIEISAFLIFIAEKEIANSGKEVESAIKIKPIANSSSFKNLINFTDEVTTNWLSLSKEINEKSKRRIKGNI